MRWTRTTSAVTTTAALAAAFFALTGAVHQGQAKAAQASRAVERGRYLSTIMGCNDCHTPGTFYGAPDFDRQLSGSELGWKGAWGVSYARNITPDKETGIGSWSEADIVKALRSGVRPDGRTLLPPMPWQNYGTLTDADVKAIAVYLMSVKPVPHHVPDIAPPGSDAAGSILVFPPPSPWDAPKGPPQGAKSEK
jgi:mono/diheme cytochrome c family protein